MTDDDEVAKCRDALMLKMAAQPPMTHAELQARVKAAKAVKKGRGQKPAPKGG